MEHATVFFSIILGKGRESLCSVWQVLHRPVPQKYSKAYHSFVIKRDNHTILDVVVDHINKVWPYYGRTTKS